jgi:dihydrofolate reductase
MGIVTFNMSVSLDGFVAGPNNEVDQLFKWYFGGDTPLDLPALNHLGFKVSPPSAEYVQRSIRGIGAMVTGRRNFTHTQAWGGNPPLGVHHFVVTHHPDPNWVKPGSPFTFVTDGVPSAIQQAKAFAGDKNVCISTASVLRQGLQVGLVDEVTLDLVPVLLGQGIRLFEDSPLTQFDCVEVVPGQGVTHLRYKILK